MDEGKTLIEGWRAWKTPAMDLFQEMPFSQVAAISNDPVNPCGVKAAQPISKT